MNENFMKEEPVLPLITSMALPMVISMMVNSLYNIVDSFFVAQISEDALHGVVLMAACIAIMPQFLSAFTNNAQVIDMGVRYSNIAFSFSLIIMLGLAFEKIFQAVGNMKVTMIALMAGCITNIILDPLLIFGIGPFPEWGIEGAAVATGIGQMEVLNLFWFGLIIGANLRLILNFTPSAYRQH